MSDWEEDDDAGGAVSVRRAPEIRPWAPPSQYRSECSEPTWRKREEDGGQAQRWNRQPARGVMEFRRRESGHDAVSKPLCFRLDSSVIGQVIGRGGAKIRELEEVSSSRIKIVKEEYDSVIKIFGNDEQQSKAKALIDEIVGRCERPESEWGCRDSYTFSSPEVKDQEKSVINWTLLRENKDKYEAMKWADMPPIQKAFYIEASSVASMSEEEVTSWRRENNNIMCSDLKEGQKRPIPNPVRSFLDAFQPFPEVMDALENAGFQTPTPIQ